MVHFLLNDIQATDILIRRWEMMIEVNYVDTLWVLMASGMVFMMHLGFATIEAGFTRAKNTVSILMKNISTVFVGSFVFCLIGFSLAFSGDGAVIGNLENVVLRGLGTGVWDGLTIPGIVFFFFQMMKQQADIVCPGICFAKISIQAFYVYSIAC